MKAFWACAAGLVMAAGAANGQMVTPPPQYPRPLGPVMYIPPRPPESMVRDMAIRNAERQRQRQMQEEARQNEHTRLPELAYESLVELDDGGRIVELTEWPDLAAIRRNPMLDRRTLALALEVASERQARMQEIVLDHLDVLAEIDAGKIENTGLLDRDGMREIRDAIRPFQSQGRLTNELQTRGILTPVQARFNLTIAREYEEAVRREKLGDPPPMDQMVYFTMRQGISEALLTYEALLWTAARHGELISREAGLGPKAAQQLASVLGKADGSSRAVAVQLARTAMEDFSTHERRLVLEFARDILVSEQRAEGR
ncbi:MAG: hypothetical protein KF866_08155 [Phycisphaeraceae bacterium]|nr:hypothetical protein [Phycisphaeraceae bacterium]MCW5753849.1 hypothetical protein [Phycisphaeraceae bacterium]